MNYTLPNITRTLTTICLFLFTHNALAITAISDTATIEINQSVTIAVLDNDKLDDGNPLTSSPFAGLCTADNDGVCVTWAINDTRTNPTQGTITLSGMSIVYTPNTDFVGTDSFSYVATLINSSAETVESSSTTVTITVNAPVVEEPVVEEPVVEEPAVEEPVAEEPVVEEATIDVPSETEHKKELVDSTISLCDRSATSELEGNCDALKDLPVEDQITALETISAEQVTAEFTSTISMSRDQSANLTSRLTQLRNNSHGMNISGLTITQEGQRVQGDWITAIYDTMSGGAAGEETNTSFPSQFGFFMNGSITNGERDETSNEMGYDLDSDNYTLGMDYRFSDSFVAGAAYGYSSSSIVFGATGDDMENQIDNVFIYSSWYKEQFYLDTTIGYSAGEIETNRRIIVPGTLNTIASGRTHTEQLIIQLAGSYDFTYEALTFGPYLRIDIIDGEIDSYSETKGGGFEVSFDKQDLSSKLVTLGGQAQYALGYSWGVLIPHLRFEMKNEFENERDVISGRFVLDPTNSGFSIVADDIDHFWLQAGAGLSAVFPYGLSAYIDYETVTELDNIELHTYSFGGRWELTF